MLLIKFLNKLSLLKLIVIFLFYQEIPKQY